MNGKAGNDDVEEAEWRQWMVEVVRDDLYAFTPFEPLTQPLEHGRREVDRHTDRRRSSTKDEIKESPIAGTEIEHPSNRPGQLVEQGGLSFPAMRNAVSLFKVTEGVRRGLPLTHRVLNVAQYHIKGGSH